MNTALFGKEFAENFKIEKEISLQYRWIVFGTYKGKPAVAKLYSSKDASVTKDNYSQEKESHDFAYKTIINAIKGDEFTTKLSQLGITLNVPKLYYHEEHEDTVVYIMEWVQGETFLFTNVTSDDLKKLCTDFLAWRNPAITEIMQKNYPDLMWWYIHDSRSLSEVAHKTLFEGLHLNSWTETPITPFKRVLEKEGLSDLLLPLQTITSNQFAKLLDSYNDRPILQHADAMAGFYERDQKDMLRKGNIQKDPNGNLIFLDLDFLSIQSNLLLGLFSDAVKFYLYLWDRDDIDNVFREMVMKTFRELPYDIDLELAWHLTLYLHTLFWELPFFARIFDITDDRRNLSLSMYNRLIEKNRESGTFIQNYRIS